MARQPRPATPAGSARPYGRCRELTRIPASAAASGLPPAATIPTNSSSDDPAMTSTLSIAGTHSGSPPATAIAPYDTPNTKTARQASPMSRPVRRSMLLQPGVLHIEPMTLIMNVRQNEHKTFLENGLCVTLAPQGVV